MASLSRGSSHGNLSHLQPLASTGDVPFSRPHSPHREITVGFYGLGAMGYFMARNLAKRLPIPLLVSNRTRSKAEQLHHELGDSKIKIVEKPEDLATECDIVFTNLANDEVVKQTYELFAAALKVYAS
jgi:glutamyl-tRNA reductase